MSRSTIILIIVAVVIIGGVFVYRSANQFDLPEGESTPINEIDYEDISENNTVSTQENSDTTKQKTDNIMTSTREILVTDGVRHSIPLNEILSGGPPKDGIPSIDDPKFISVFEADEDLSNDSPGLGVTIEGESRFYPYQILVWHEIVNDTLSGSPILVTYCPLCATGVVFDRRVGGEVQEFGVSGRLWQSNLLMYNRTGNEDTESLWSQVLGEAVLGPATGERLGIVRSDTVLYGEWKKLHSDTEVLSRDTGTIRTYGVDPYGNYYTNETVSFGATFSDDRLHPKAFVFGVETDGQYKAYDNEAIPEGITTDVFAGKNIRIEKDSIGGVSITADGSRLPYISGFWFSWLAVHPGTELFK